MSTPIVIGDFVYIPTRGVGRAVSWRANINEEGQRNPYWNVLFGNLSEELVYEHMAMRAVPSFAGWFWESADGVLRPVPSLIPYERPAWARPNLQNIPAGRHSV